MTTHLRLDASRVVQWLEKRIASSVKMTAIVVTTVVLGKRWGATEDEVHRSLPGDDLVPHPMLETTHAITIHAPAAAIWPWLVQMGYDRGWWYTDARWYRLLETSLWKAKPHTSADRIIPEFQHLAVGDTV